MSAVHSLLWSANLPSAMATAKHLRGKLPLTAITVTVGALVLVALLYNERTITFSPSNVFGFKSCGRRNAGAGNRGTGANTLTYTADDQFNFDLEKCSLATGKWVFNRSVEPLYSDRTCPYVELQVACGKNGRIDSDYLYWQWQPDDCILPRFDPKIALQILKGKRLMFVGDSLQRGQWQSLVCLIDSVIPKTQKLMKHGQSHNVFKAKEYGASIEFYWAPFLVESNSDNDIVTDPDKRILKINSVEKHAKYWKDVDILVFGTYIWWMSNPKIKSIWGSFANGEEEYEELIRPVSYTIALKTWANWVDSNHNPNTTKVFFTTMSPVHHRSEDWGNDNGTKCYNETQPATEGSYQGIGSDGKMVSVVAGILKRMKFPVTVMNITQLSKYRIDGHTSINTESGGKVLTDEQKADPLHYADCIHWCLPGVPDTWNRILFAHLLHREKVNRLEEHHKIRC